MKNYTEWSSADYLKQYYSTVDITADEAAIAKFVVKFLAETGQYFPEMLEVGCGPTVHHAFPFAPLVGRIYMADYVVSNLPEIQKWIDGVGHDWTPYLTGVLTAEGNTSATALSQRIELLKSKIAGLLPCNAIDVHPIGTLRRFPLVTSFYCLECIGQDKAQWGQAMRNVSSLVAPKGHLILSALRKADKYIVLEDKFPATNIDENDLKEALVGCGFDPTTINVEVHKSGWEEEGFDTILIASAQKKD